MVVTLAGKAAVYSGGSRVYCRHEAKSDIVVRAKVSPYLRCGLLGLILVLIGCGAQRSSLKEAKLGRKLEQQQSGRLTPQQSRWRIDRFARLQGRYVLSIISARHRPCQDELLRLNALAKDKAPCLTFRSLQLRWIKSLATRSSGFGRDCARLSYSPG